jgi:hypothetical protein
MRSVMALCVLSFALTFCGLGERLKSLTGGGTSNGAGPSSNSGSTESSSAERPTLTASQREIQSSSKEVNWDDQNISFKLPPGWPKMDVKKDSFNYGSPTNGFLIASISVMPDSFPAEVSIKATYDSALEQLKQGNYETLRWLEIDGVKGVEWKEALKEKDGIRRHQWIAFRRYQGQNQQINIIISTNGEKFDAQKDTFAAIMYSMKIAKG